MLEVWKGDIEKGEWITVPELARFADKKSRAVSGRPGRKVPLSIRPRMAASRIKGYIYGWSPLFVADHVTCKRMVLFLNRVSEAVEKLPEGDGGDSVHYVPAGFEGNIKTSVAWIEHGWAYFYMRFFNPGDVKLHGPGPSEKDLKAKVIAEVARHAYEEARLAKAQATVALLAGVDSAAERIALLKPHVMSETAVERKFALVWLGKEGDAALPLLCEIFEDLTLNFSIRWAALFAMGAQGAKAGPYLASLLEKELAYWREVGPTLQVGWWGGVGLTEEQQQQLRRRYGTTSEVMGKLHQTGYTGCADIVREFRDFWRSLPQLEDKTGLSQMSETAEEILQKCVDADAGEQ